MAEENLVIGVDFGTDSVRSLIVDASNGKVISNAVFHYPRWKAGKYCNAEINQFRQHPLDYLEGLETTIKEALQKSPALTAQKIKAISVDTTGSTPVAVDKDGTPLAMLFEFMDNPNAMFILWKDHTAIEEANEINRLSKSWGGTDYTSFSGGLYSSEWFWAKILHILRTDEKVRHAAFSWVEHCDWISAVLTGNTNPLKLKRSRCAAGHKAIWHESFPGLPSEEFLSKLDPLLKGLRERLYSSTYTCNEKLGTISKECAERLGLNENVIIGVGGIDAHTGAVGGGIKPHLMAKIIGTSTCDILVATKEEIGSRMIKGISGQVDGSVIPGLIGLEAGQSAFGDIYAWFKRLLMWPLDNVLAAGGNLSSEAKEKILTGISDRLIPALSEKAESIPVNESGLLALDWLNGRRNPDINLRLKGAITGLTLASDAPKIFRALVEATAFGARRIIERYTEQGMQISGIFALGGVADKSDFVMQVLSDVIGMSISVTATEHTCALGAAMFASVASGIHPDIESAQKVMGCGFDKVYTPEALNKEKYDKLYKRYIDLGEFIEHN